MPRYSEEPDAPGDFTRSFDKFYSRSARLYDIGVKLVPFWKTWLRHAVPHLQGSRILEVSFGTGYLLTECADEFDVHGIDFNDAMVKTAQSNLRSAGKNAQLLRGTVEALPYQDASFDSLLNTMAFTGYPDAVKALSEMVRVLRPGGKLVMIDANYPSDGNWLGTRLTDGWKRAGDIIRDMSPLFDQFSLNHTDEEIGGRGSIHLYVGSKPS